MEAVDCQPDFCLDLFEPSGHGRRRRNLADNSTYERENERGHEHDRVTNTTIDFTKFKENIEYSVLLPGEFDHLKGFQDPDQCKNFVLISGLLALLLTLSTILVCRLATKRPTHTKILNLFFNIRSHVRSYRRFRTSIERPMITCLQRDTPDVRWCNENGEKTVQTKRDEHKTNVCVCIFSGIL